jgi:hypothetical protein
MVLAGSVNELTSIELARGTADHGTSRPLAGAPAAAEEEVRQRLTLWLAEVSAEAALAPLQGPRRPEAAPTAEPTPR